MFSCQYIQHCLYSAAPSLSENLPCSWSAALSGPSTKKTMSHTSHKSHWMLKDKTKQNIALFDFWASKDSWFQTFLYKHHNNSSCVIRGFEELGFKNTTTFYTTFNNCKSWQNWVLCKWYVSWFQILIRISEDSCLQEIVKALFSLNPVRII